MKRAVFFLAKYINLSYRLQRRKMSNILEATTSFISNKIIYVVFKLLLLRHTISRTTDTWYDKHWIVIRRHLPRISRMMSKLGLNLGVAIRNKSSRYKIIGYPTTKLLAVYWRWQADHIARKSNLFHLVQFFSSECIEFLLVIYIL